MKKQALFLLSCGLSLCGCSNANDNIDNNIAPAIINALLAFSIKFSSFVFLL